MSDSAQFDPYALSPESIQEPPRSLWAALRKIGPGIILAGSIIGSGELLLTTHLGAKYGFIFLWLILFSCVIKVFVQIELGRYALSSGKPTLAAFDALPGPRLGAHWLVWWWLMMFLLSLVQLGAMVGGVGQALHMAFPEASPWLAQRLSSMAPRLGEAVAARPEHPWAVLTALAAMALLLSGGYRRIERVTTLMVAAVTFVTVVCVAMLPGTGNPVTLGEVAEGFSPALFALPAAALASAFSVFGITGVGASELYAYPYWCLEKGYGRFTGPRSDDPHWGERARGWMRVMHLDAWVSMVVFTIATVAFYTLGATILHRQHLAPQGPKMIETLSEMYVPAFGAWTKVFFLVGVFAVLFKTLYVASASNSRLSADFLEIARLKHYRDAGDRMFWIKIFCAVFPLVGLFAYFVFRDPKVMVQIGGFVQAITLPILAGAAVYLRYFRTDGRLRPSPLSDICLWIALISISAFAAYSVVQTVAGMRL